MALSNGNNQVSGNLIILRPITRDKDKKDINVCFSAVQKVDEKWSETDRYTQVTGNIKSVENHTETYEGNDKHSIKILMSDDSASESYLLDLRMNILNRSMLNSLISLKATENVNISLYKNKKGYDTAAIRCNGELVGWKYQFSEIPKAVDINHPKTGVKIQSDYSEVDEFFLTAVEEWARGLNIWKGQGDTGVLTKSSISVPAPEKGEADDGIDW